MNPNLFNNDDSLSNLRKVTNDIIKNKSIDEIIDFIKKECWTNFSLMTADDYSQSLIFCIGNIDEAYNMHHSSDPDADADIFYEHSLKITMPKMKQALGRRFRMEQIGRLGNNHIIYPAFNKSSYAKIIDKHIDIRKKHFETEFGINIAFDDSIHDIVYKECVFPTQGVRPLLSTFNTMLDSYISKIISDLILNHPNVQNVIWKFDITTEKYIIEIQDENKANIGRFSYDVKLNIDKLRKSDFSQRQAYTAVHEAGHAVIACVKAGLIPKEVVSKTASVAEGFCRTEWPDINTKELMYKQIMVCLGGIEAEKLIFGEDFLSDGTGSDLEKATTNASLMVKYYGMSNHNYHVTIKATQQNEFSSIHDFDNIIESEVKNILDNAQKDVKECLNKHKLFLLDLSDHLSNNSKILQEDLKEIAVKYIKDTDIKDKDKYYDFKSIIQGLKQAEEAKLNNKGPASLKIEIEPNLRFNEVILNAAKKR